jgi:hypothetical protein
MVAISVTALTDSTQLTGRVGSSTPRRGILGAAGGVYIGPVRPNATSHATSGNAGGAEDSTGYRESDTYDASGATSGFMGSGGGTVSSSTRGGGSTGAVGGTGPQQRTASIANGVQGGSAPTAGQAGVGVVDTTGRAESTGVDRFGRTKNSVAQGTGAGKGYYDYTNFDGRSNAAGSRADVGQGRGSIATGTGPADAVTGETVSRTVGVRPTRSTASTQVGGAALGTGTLANRATVGTIPLVGTTADPAAGTIAVVGGATKVQVDLHADDITGGANLRAGAEVVIFKRGGDTDEDVLSEVARFKADGGTDITDAVTGLAAATYAFYGRFLYTGSPSSGGNLTNGGPWSARGTVVVS